MTLHGNEKPTPVVVDLFCGAGGLASGFRQAGFRIVHAIDCWEPAVDTYRSNHGDHVLGVPVHRSLELPRADVFVGGPPCQGFSSAGHRRGNDDRNSLVVEYAALIARHRPRAFVFENVEGFLTGADGDFVLQFLDEVIAAGYCVHLRKINAANFGVPQHRKRVVAIGGLGWEPSFPQVTHAAFGAPGAELANSRGLPPTPTVNEALSILPPPRCRGQGSVDECHVYEPLEGDDLRRAGLLEQGQCMRDLPEELWHPSYRRRANRRVQDGTPTERRGGPPAGLRRLHGDEPSKAITGGALRDFLHPSENRLLTVRECAVLQTFPLDFHFAGSRADRIQQIGNAVPPLLARVIARGLMEDLASAGRTGAAKGSLLSFVPTSSTGMSPALQHTVSRVHRRYQHREPLRVQRALWD
jgi:DNA (cytosine-5)-methyltransferase 1